MFGFSFKFEPHCEGFETLSFAFATWPTKTMPKTLWKLVYTHLFVCTSVFTSNCVIIFCCCFCFVLLLRLVVFFSLCSRLDIMRFVVVSSWANGNGFFASRYFAIDLMVFLTENSNIWLFLLIYQIKSILSPTLVEIQNKNFSTKA